MVIFARGREIWSNFAMRTNWLCKKTRNPRSRQYMSFQISGCPLRRLTAVSVNRLRQTHRNRLCFFRKPAPTGPDHRTPERKPALTGSSIARRKPALTGPGIEHVLKLGCHKWLPFFVPNGSMPNVIEQTVPEISQGIGSQHQPEPETWRGIKNRH